MGRFDSTNHRSGQGRSLHECSDGTLDGGQLRIGCPLLQKSNLGRIYGQPKLDGPYAERIEGLTDLLKNPDGRPKLKGSSQIS